MKSNGSGTRSTQPREYNSGATWKKNSGSGLENLDTAVEIRRADHATSLSPLNLALTSSKSGGRSVGIVQLRTKATELLYTYYSLL
jgi:hypothetical protein